MPISFDTATSQQDGPLKTETMCYRGFQEEGYYSEPEKHENLSSVTLLEGDSITSSPDVIKESAIITDVTNRHDEHNNHNVDELSSDEDVEEKSISNDSNELKADNDEFTDQLTHLHKILGKNGELSSKPNISEINPASTACAKSFGIYEDQTGTDGQLKQHTRDFNSKLPPDSPADQRVPRRRKTPSDVVPDTSSISSNGKVRCYRCKQCEYVSVMKTDFWEHLKTHIKTEKLLTCPKCPFVTEYKHHLEYHLRNHFGSKPFKCPKCNYSCVNKSMLNSHMKSHSNIYQYRCADCSYVSKYCHSLKLHLRKYAHKPSVVLNVDGTLNSYSVIDVYGKKRGPRSKKQKTEVQQNSPSSQSPKTPVVHIPPIEQLPATYPSKSPVVSPSHGLKNLENLKNSHAMNGFQSNMSLRPPLLLKSVKSSNKLFSGPAPEKTPNTEDSLLSKTNLQLLNCNLCDFTTEIQDLFSKHLIKQHVTTNNQDMYKICGNTSKSLPQIQDQPQINENQKLEENVVLRDDHSLRLKSHTQMTENLAKNIPSSDFSFMFAKSKKFTVPSLLPQKLDCAHTPPMLATPLTSHSVSTHQILLTSISLPSRIASPEIKPDTHFPLDLSSYRAISPNLSPSQPVSPQFSKTSTVDHPPQEVPCRNYVSTSEPTQSLSSNFRNRRRRKAMKLESCQLSTDQRYSPEDFVKFHKEMNNTILTTEAPNEPLSKKSQQCMNFISVPTYLSSVVIDSTNSDEAPSTINVSEGKFSSHVETFTSTCNFDVPEKAPRMTRPVSEPVLAKSIGMPEQPLSFPYRVSSLFFGNNGLNKKHKENVMASNGHYPNFPYHNMGMPDALKERFIYPSSRHTLPVKQNGTEIKKTPSSGSEEYSKWQDSYTCKYCDLAFKDCVMYTMHMGYHGYQDPFTCNMCGQQNKDKVSFFLHIARAAHQ
ncbi:zinc finger E-box-binding homeobox 1-like [Limulus polyphemus]|uniref:Zinc finger E-box-binding homeobox 1-like n=1 Tax=Limulus polyphemus TaxID=6850 RepID=A0ABM1BC57_LIMPO|nr:zinc finger E-box-binding homeobox 1-like [Limulus polyphemus]